MGLSPILRKTNYFQILNRLIAEATALVFVKEKVDTPPFVKEIDRVKQNLQ